MFHNVRGSILSCAILLMTASCQRNKFGDHVDQLLTAAGDNAGELQAVLDRYEDERRELAEYAVAATWGRQLFNIDLYDLNLNAQ